MWKYNNICSWEWQWVANDLGLSRQWSDISDLPWYQLRHQDSKGKARARFSPSGAPVQKKIWGPLILTQNRFLYSLIIISIFLACYNVAKNEKNCPFVGAPFLPVHIRNCCNHVFWENHGGPIKTRSSAIAKGPRDASCQLKSCQLPSNSAETTSISPEHTTYRSYEDWGLHWAAV